MSVYIYIYILYVYILYVYIYILYVYIYTLCIYIYSMYMYINTYTYNHIYLYTSSQLVGGILFMKGTAKVRGFAALDMEQKKPAG